MLVTVRRDVGPVTMLLARHGPVQSGRYMPSPVRSGRSGPVRPGAMRWLSDGIGTRGFRIALPLLSLTATVLPLWRPAG
jgi:hypothetical protein